MKYLLMFLIISACGKYQEPPTQDLRDSDGDQILNSFDSDKLVATQEDNIKVYGTIDFDIGNNIKKIHSFDVNNEIDLNEISKKVLTRNEKAIRTWKYTSPYIVLSFKEPKLLALTNEIYYLNVSLKSSEENFSSYLLLEENKTTNLGKWEAQSTLKLDKSQLESVLNGDAYLVIEKDLERRVVLDQQLQKTYPLFFNNGTNTQLLRVSNDLSVNDFLKRASIKAFTIFDPKKILKKNHYETKSWWLRSTGNIHSVVFASEKEVYETYLKGFESRKHVVTRQNGISNSIVIRKSKEAGVILSIKGSRAVNTFSEEDKNEWIQAGPMRTGCTTTSRIAVKTEALLSTEDIVSNIGLQSNYGSLNDQIKYSVEEGAVEFKIDTPVSEINLSLKDLPSNTFYRVGTITTTCGKQAKTHLVNQEDHMTLEIEALVEIILD